MKYQTDINSRWSHDLWMVALAFVIIFAGYVIGSILLEALVPIYQLIQVLGG